MHSAYACKDAGLFPDGFQAVVYVSFAGRALGRIQCDADADGGILLPVGVAGLVALDAEVSCDVDSSLVSAVSTSEVISRPALMSVLPRLIVLEERRLTSRPAAMVTVSPKSSEEMGFFS